MASRCARLLAVAAGIAAASCGPPANVDPVGTHTIAPMPVFRTVAENAVDLIGLTTDDDVIYVDHDHSVHAVPVSGGESTFIAPSASWGEVRGRVVFLTASASDVYSIWTRAGGLHTLDDRFGVPRAASSDGRWVAGLEWADDGNHELHLIAADGSTDRMLGEYVLVFEKNGFTSPECPLWGFDFVGDRLVAYGCQARADGGRAVTLRSYSVADGSAVTLAQDDSEWLATRPGSDEILVGHNTPWRPTRFADSKPSHEANAWLVSVDGREVTPVASDLRPLDLSQAGLSRVWSYATISPDGKWILYQTPGRQLVAFDIENRRVASRSQLDYPLTWMQSVAFAPDSSRAVFCEGGYDANENFHGWLDLIGLSAGPSLSRLGPSDCFGGAWFVHDGSGFFDLTSGSSGTVDARDTDGSLIRTLTTDGLSYFVSSAGKSGLLYIDSIDESYENCCQVRGDLRFVGAIDGVEPMRLARVVSPFFVSHDKTTAVFLRASNAAGGWQDPGDGLYSVSLP